MTMLPPRWVRRLVLGPLTVVLTVVVATSLPLWLLLAACLSPLLPFSRWRPLRVLWVMLVHLGLEALALVALFVLWVASGFGWRLRTPRFERWHYDLVRIYLRTVYREARRVLHVRVTVEGPDPDAYSGRPLLVLSRHAGPGDSFLLVHALVDWYDREPRLVLKDTMQWDPAIDVLLNRLPNRFISTEPGRTGDVVEQQIGDLASNLDDDDAFVIFPEGGNFTERRRARAIERLRRRGLMSEADRAAQMRNVLAPRPGGVLAALAHAPDADVVWVAHTGTDHLHSVMDVWRELPMDTEIRMRWWHVPSDDVPEGRDARIDWLYTWWERIDDWITENRGATADAVDPAA
ncbi:MAG: 1-acyl-sn-glycerol-3-phosphate acyltransferase [Actinomycetes bacterium]